MRDVACTHLADAEWYLRPGGGSVWHVVALQRSLREWVIRQGWGGRPVRQEQAQGIQSDAHPFGL